MPNVSMTAPTDYSVEMADILRRQKLAELMQQQANEPIGQPRATPQGWVPAVNPLQIIAKGLQGYNARAGEENALNRQKELAKQMQMRAQQQMSQMPQGTPGVPEQQQPALGGQDAAGQNMQGPQQPIPAQAAQGPDPEKLRQWAAMLATEGLPGTAGIGQHVLSKSLDNSMQPPKFGHAGPGSVMYDQRTGQPTGNQVPFRPEKPPEQWSEPYQLSGATVKRNLDTGEVKQVVTREPQTHVYAPPAVTVTELQDPDNQNGTIKVDARTGKVLGKGPKLTDTGKMEAKRQFNMQGIGSVIKKAEDILGGAGGSQLPTGSGVGTAVDYAASIVGASPSGAKEADQLRSVGASLVSKMPRMEGPQSDKDVALYKEAAGRIGDSMLPIERRKAALETVKGIWSKYERLNPDAFQTTQNQGGGLSPAEQQELQQLRQRFGK